MQSNSGSVSVASSIPPKGGTPNRGPPEIGTPTARVWSPAFRRSFFCPSRERWAKARPQAFAIWSRKFPPSRRREQFARCAMKNLVCDESIVEARRFRTRVLTITCSATIRLAPSASRSFESANTAALVALIGIWIAYHST